MDNETILEVINKLIGPVSPVGETHTDNKRLNNLASLCAVNEKIIQMISEVAEDNKASHLYSEKRAGDYADLRLSELLQQLTSGD